MERKKNLEVYLDNIIFELQNVGGISHYWCEFVNRVYKEDSVNLKMIEISKGSNNIYRNKCDFDKKIIINKKNCIKIIQRYLPVKINKKNKFIFHSSYYRYTTNKNAIQIVIVHDFMYEKYEKGIKLYVHKFQKKSALRRAHVIICISKNTKKDLLKIYPEFSNKEIRVIYNGVSDSYYPLLEPNDYLKGKYSILNKKKYVLVVGSRIGCKNFDLISKTINELDSSYYFVFVGKSLSNLENAKILNNFENIIVYSDIPECELNILYNNAHCLFFPSLYEGFGIPLVEAMKSACPIVTTNLSSVPEIVLDAALFVDPFNVTDSINKIISLENQSNRDELIQKGIEYSKVYSWDKTFDSIISIYEECLNKKL